MIRIANAHGFWGDQLDAAAELLAAEPHVDYLTLDFLAEVSMSILAAQRAKDPRRGYARDFLDVVQSLTPYWKRGGRCRVVTNAGGLNPLECGLACQQLLRAGGCEHIKIAVVTGDDVLSIVTRAAEQGGNAESFRNMDTNESIDKIASMCMTANAYLGAQPLVTALQDGADLVITGRVADPSLAVAPCMLHFGWQPTDYDKIAGATVAGHLIECGAQVTGGIFTDWLSLPNAGEIAFPIVEVNEDGCCVVTKPAGSGGCVNEFTVTEQLVYEIGDPSAYLSPDATVSFSALKVASDGENRVKVSGAVGGPPPETYKVSATFRNGYWAAGTLTICGSDCSKKALRAAAALRDRLARKKLVLKNQTVEVLGGGGSLLFTSASRRSASESADPPEVVLRIAVSDDSRESVERFTRNLMPLITAGAPGTTGYAAGRPRVHPLIGYWPCLIPRDQVEAKVAWLEAGDSSERSTAPTVLGEPKAATETCASQAVSTDMVGFVTEDDTCENVGTLETVAMARSGDKGIHANIGVISRRTSDFPRLLQWLTAAKVADFFGIAPKRVLRYELPNLHAVNFILKEILSNPLRTDAQGKALGQCLLRMPLDDSFHH